MMINSTNSLHTTITTTSPTATTISNSITQLPCYLVNNLTTNSHEQCKFILDNNCLEREATFDYVYLVYCELGYELRYISIALLAFLVIVLFLALSSIADEFLCPSLLSVAKNLRMSDSLAGVTLLAFGNGCPDIFASIAAASGDRSELIVGELLGAGIFCTSIVAGLIFIHSDFKLATRPILRDTTFYLFAVYLVWCYCESKEVTFYESLTFILIYVIYLIVALSGQAIHSRLLGNYSIAERQGLEQMEEKTKNENWFSKWREESLRRKQQNLKNQLEQYKLDQSGGMIGCDSTGSGDNNKEKNLHLKENSFPIKEAHNNNNQQQSLEMDSYSIIKINANHNCEIISSNGKEEKKIEPTKQVSCCYMNQAFVAGSICDINDICQKRQQQHHSKQTYNNFMMKEEDKLKIKVQSIIQNGSTNVVQINNKKFDITNSDDLNKIDDLLLHIAPIDWHEWKGKNIIGKIINIIRAPLLFAAIITIPVVDYDKKRNNWCRLLNSIHCLTIPLVITIMIGSNFSDLFQTQKNNTNNTNNNSSDITIIKNFLTFLPAPIIVLIIASLLCAFVLKTSTLQVAPKYHFIFAYFGFIMSILWIYTIANEIIGLLKTVGILFSMTDTAIGLGILAWGNSLGDIVANISLAEAGYPRMALGASIGAPLLNLLLGFGLSFTLSMKPGESTEIEYSPTITLLCLTLAIILIAIMLSTLIPQNKSKKPFGYMLISGYGVYFALAICFEYGIIKF